MPDPDRDPILRLIGSLDVEPFADKIDEELYGTAKYKKNKHRDTGRAEWKSEEK